MYLSALYRKVHTAECILEWSEYFYVDQSLPVMLSATAIRTKCSTHSWSVVHVHNKLIQVHTDTESVF